MIKVFQVIFFGVAAVMLTGCNGSEQDKPVWADVNLVDLGPSHIEPGRKMLKTANFDVYVFEMPAEKIDSLEGIWEQLYTQPLQFSEYEAFSANSFSIGFAEISMWGQINKILSEAGAKKRQTISLLLLDGQMEDVFVEWLKKGQTVFYFSTPDSMEGATVGPGVLALRIQAKKIGSSRGVCRVNAVPVSAPSRRYSIQQSVGSRQTGEFVFGSAGFGLKMSPGDFIILGPKKYISHQITLGSLFFSKTTPRSVVRIFLVICTGMHY